jgi:hypothetical protein
MTRYYKIYQPWAKQGAIGSPAAVGLRKGGDDGRFLWIPGMREIEGVFNAEYIKIKTGIAEIKSAQGELVTGDDGLPWFLVAAGDEEP